VSVRRIALLISAFAVAACAAPIPSAAAETHTLPELRTQLRQTRSHLENARTKATSAAAGLAEIQALAQAAGGLPVVAGEFLPAADDPAADPAAAGVAALIAALDPALAERLLGDGVITEDEVGQMRHRVDAWRGLARRFRRTERRLERTIALRLRIAEWNRRGAWRPLIRVAAHRYNVSPDGLYRLMMYESGGRRFAGSTYKGLFQYYPGTWRASWNPWRTQSIANGWAQIQATAYAIRRGMGPANWPCTYHRAF